MRLVILPDIRRTLQQLSTFCWELTKAPKVIHMFGPPLSSCLHNLGSALKPKQMLALDRAKINNFAAVAASGHGSQGLQHAVFTALPPVLQSHARKLMSLQNWSTLQQTTYWSNGMASKFEKQRIMRHK